MIAIVVRSPMARALALDAARRVQPAAEVRSLGEVADFLREARSARCLVIHDFAPDPAESVREFRGEVEEGRGFGLLALLEPPLTPKLDLLLCGVPALPLVGVLVAGEAGVEWLAERIRWALARSSRRALLEMLVSSWALDPVLTRVAACELTAERPHTTLEGLLREAGVGRKAFVRVARETGMSPPLRFLQGLRVMEVADLLQQGCTTARAAERLGYGSVDTLRGHFRVLVGLTPRSARRRPLEELARVVGAGWRRRDAD